MASGRERTGGAVQRVCSDDVASRLTQIVAGWRGAERGQALRDLHRECVNAAGPGGQYLLPADLRVIRGLDAAALRRQKPRLYGNVTDHVRFRVAPAGRFDAALVPIGPMGQACDRWLLAIEEELPIQDQVALYAHALGHALLNREMQLNGRAPLLDPSAGYAHADSIDELRRVESTSPLDRRVLDTYPLLTDLVRVPEEPERAPAPAGLRERLAGWGWRGRAVAAPYAFTEGRVFISNETVRRGRRLRVDALLRYEASLPIAVAQVLRQDEKREDAELRLDEYAYERLGLPFAYLIEEDGPVQEWDWTGGSGPARRQLDRVPDRDELWERWVGSLGLGDAGVKNSLCYPYSLHGGKPPRYYQEAAINHTVIAVLRAQRRLRLPRILLNLATGTGKTPIAFQIVWKLKRSRAIRNVLFITDRDFLLGQAMDNHFAPFGEARARVQGGLETAHDVIFATYQALAGDSTRADVYRQYPSDFFDLVIVDECHRGSGGEESNWRLILNHFKDAVQIGLTATPQHTDNVKTYDYFGKPVRAYSLHRGIMDGFLAPYRVRRVKLGPANRTTEMQIAERTANGRHAPSLADSKDDAHPLDHNPAEDQMESAETLIGATEVIAEHLARYLRATDPMAKTIVFCVDQAHAERMREALTRECEDLVARHNDYVQRIVSDEGTEGRWALGRFGQPDEPAPVIVTTSRLLSTGVDVPTCKNIVLARRIGSIVEFKQIIGRGTRLHPPQKTWFTILDYAGATRHFFDSDFDGDPEAIEVEVLQPRPEAESAHQPAGAPQQPEAQNHPHRANGSEGAEGGLAPAERISEVRSKLSLDGQERASIDSAVGHALPGVSGESASNPAQPGGNSLTPPLGAPGNPGQTEKPDGPRPAAAGADEPPPAVEGHSQVRRGSAERNGKSSPAETDPGADETSVTKAQVSPVEPEPPQHSTTVRERPRDGKRIAVIGEYVYEMGPDGKPRPIESYSDYTREALAGLCDSAEDLKARWLRPEQRRELRDILEDEGVDLGELAAALQVPDADPRDLLLHVAFGEPVHTRGERAGRLRREHAVFFQRFDPRACEILDVVLDKYIAGEAPDISDLELLKVRPLSDQGTFMELIRTFGDGQQARAALRELETLLYAN